LRGRERDCGGGEGVHGARQEQLGAKAFWQGASRDARVREHRKKRSGLRDAQCSHGSAFG
jgi:hypothetical protein